MLNSHNLPPLSGQKPKQVVILLHGYGDSGAGLIDIGGLWQKGLPDAEFVAPDAPYPCDMVPYGFQWFGLQSYAPEAILQGTKQVVPLLNDYIDHIAASRALPFDKIALMGFSQGTMMSLYVAPRRTDMLACVVAYSGSLVGGAELQIEKQSSPPVLLVHGMEDTVIPFGAMALAEQGLKQAGIAVDVLPCPRLAHSIDDDGLAAGLAFLQKNLLVSPVSK